MGVNHKPSPRAREKFVQLLLKEGVAIVRTMGIAADADWSSSCWNRVDRRLALGSHNQELGQGKLIEFGGRGVVGKIVDRFLRIKPLEVGFEGPGTLNDQGLCFVQGNGGEVDVIVRMRHHLVTPLLELVPVVPASLWKGNDARVRLPAHGRAKVLLVTEGNDVETRSQAESFIDVGNLVEGFLEAIVKTQSNYVSFVPSFHYEIGLPRPQRT
jgi:hypothetical protein